MTSAPELVTFTADEHAVLAATGRATPLGDALREYWVPALLSEEVPSPGSAPVRVRLLGDDLVAFRDVDGRVGLLEEHCVHRGASLFHGRVDDRGIQCVYHGWVFDADGANVENPTCPALAGDARVAQPSYPTYEAGGLVMAYLGDGDAPPVPDMGWFRVGDDARFVSKRHHPCHWLQALEADIDSAHVAYLHREDLVAAGSRGADAMLEHTDPVLVVDDAPSGLYITALRELQDGTTYARVNHWLTPFYTVVPADNPEGTLGIHAWVPIDDESCWVYGMTWTVGSDLSDEQRAGYAAGTRGIYAELVPGSYVAVRNAANGYGLDREAQRTGAIWTGVAGNQEQDDVITASMGPAYDRTRERLVPTDAAVIATRRAVLAMAADHAAGRPLLGVDGRGFDVPSVFIEIPTGEDWRDQARHAMEPKQVTGLLDVTGARA